MLYAFLKNFSFYTLSINNRSEVFFLVSLVIFRCLWLTFKCYLHVAIKSNKTHGF